MKKILIYSLSLCISMLIPSIGFADFFTGGVDETIASKIPVVSQSGRIDNATQSWSGSFITNFDTSKSPLNGSQEMYFDNNTSRFGGFFVLTAACATTDCKNLVDTTKWDDSAFVAFLNDDATKAYLDPAGGVDEYFMKGFAWSKSSGWISFYTGRSDTVRYNRSTGLFTGFAWSKNLGYINMNGLIMISKAPNINIANNIMLVNHNTTLGTGTITKPEGLEPYKLDFAGSSIYPKDSSGDKIVWTQDAPIFLGVDLRLPSTGYKYEYSDPFGNITKADLKVFTDVPTDTLYDSTSKPLISLGSADPKADGLSKQIINVDLHDKYGNPIKTEMGYKTVKFDLVMENKVSPVQIPYATFPISTLANSYGKSVKFSGTLDTTDSAVTFDNGFRANSVFTATVYTGSYTHRGSGSMEVISYVPTDSVNTLQVKALHYEITADPVYSSNNIGQIIGNALSSPLSINFDRAGSGDFSLESGTIGKFGLGLPFQTYARNVANIPSWSSSEFYHLYNTQTGGTSIGNIISFSGITTTPIVTNSPNRQYWRYLNRSSTNEDFTLIPEVNIGSGLLTSIDFELQHKVIHKFNNGIYDFAYVFGGAAGTGVTQNRGIKIIGTASTSNSGSIFALNTQDEYTKVGNFSKPQVKDFVRQNVEAIIRNPSTDALVKDNVPFDLNSTDSSWQSKQTIIVRGEDLTISTDVPVLGNGKPRAIIVIGGYIKIGPNVKNIYASIFTDRGLYAIDGGSPITDSNRSNNQLYIFGTLISGNTVGTSAQSANGGACPDFLPKTCSPDEKKRYDLNFLRTGPTNFASAISSETDLNVYPVVIRYNPKLTSDPPPGFKKIAR